MPRGGSRPGSGRPREGYEGRELYVALTPQGWKRLEAFLEVIGRVRGERYRARLLGILLIRGAEVVAEGLRKSGRMRR